MSGNTNSPAGVESGDPRDADGDGEGPWVLVCEARACLSAACEETGDGDLASALATVNEWIARQGKASREG